MLALSLPVRISRALLVASIVAAVPLYVLGRPDLWFVERVAFSGHHRATVAELRHLADLPNGTRVWEVDAPRITADVERHPWVRRASLSRPDWRTVHIEVEEHRPVALLHHGRLLYVNEHGEAFLEADPNDLDYPNLTGIAPTLAEQHPRLPSVAVRRALALLRALDERGLVAREQVDEIHFSRTRGFTVHTRGSRLLFGLDGFDEQLDRLAVLLTSGTVDLDRPSYVDLGPRTVAIVRRLEAPGEG